MPHLASWAVEGTVEERVSPSGVKRDLFMWPGQPRPPLSPPPNPCQNQAGRREGSEGEGEEEEGQEGQVAARNHGHQAPPRDSDSLLLHLAGHPGVPTSEYGSPSL